MVFIGLGPPGKKPLVSCLVARDYLGTLPSHIVAFPTGHTPDVGGDDIAITRQVVLQRGKWEEEGDPHRRDKRRMFVRARDVSCVLAVPAVGLGQPAEWRSPLELPVESLVCARPNRAEDRAPHSVPSLHWGTLENDALPFIRNPTLRCSMPAMRNGPQGL